MKKDKHPEYQDVLFVDSSTGTKFLIGSTLKTKETATYEGKEYPVFPVAVSSASHPLFTGSEKVLDTEGRVDRFKKRYEKAAAPKTEPVVEEKKPKAPKKKTTSTKKK